MEMGAKEISESRLRALPTNYSVAPIPLPSRISVTNWISVWFKLIHCIALKSVSASSLQFVKRVVGYEVEIIGFGKVAVTDSHGHLRVDLPKAFGQQASLQVGLIDAFVAQATEFVLAGIG